MQNRFSPRTTNIITIASLALLPLIFFWRQTLGQSTLGDDDAVFWFFPAYQFVAEQIKSGNLPLWTPYLYSGSPLFAQWQAGALDPINWIYLIATTSRTLTLSLQISFAVSLISTFIFTRLIGYRLLACIVSAIIYSLSGFAVGRTLYPGFLHIIALIPLVLFFIERLHRRGRLLDAVGGGMVVAWQLFAAHPQPLVYSSLLACAYALFLTFFSKYESAISRIKFLTRVSLIFPVGAGLAAVQLLPAAEIARDSVRTEWPYELFTLQSLHPVSLITTLFPFFHGDGRGIYKLPVWGAYWSHNESQIYLGVAAISLALAGTVFARQVRYRPGIFWAGLVICCTILSLGRYSPPLSWVLYYIPLVNHFRSPNRYWIGVALGVAVIAGYAVDRLLSGEAERLARPARMAAFFLTGLCGVVASFVLLNRELSEKLIRALPGMSRNSPGFLQAAGAEFYFPVVMALCASAVIWLVTRRRSGFTAICLLIAFLLVDFNLYAVFAPIDNPDRLEALIGRGMPRQLAEMQRETDPIRYHLMLNPAAGEFSPFWFYGHEMVTGYDPILNQKYKTFSGIDEAGRSYLTTMLEKRDRTLDILNARYLMVSPVYFDPPAGQGDPSPVDLTADRRARYEIRPGSGERLLIVSSLSNSAEIPDGQKIADVVISCGGKAVLKTGLLAGRDTAEWAYDRADVRRVIKHSRPPIAESRPADNGFQAHSYLTEINLPPSIVSCSGSRAVEIAASAPERVSLTLHRLALKDSTGSDLQLVRRPPNHLDDGSRWSELNVRSEAQPYRDFRVFENVRAMPRAWLVDHAQEAYEGDQLKMIRGELRDKSGSWFDPSTTVLVEPVRDPLQRWYSGYLNAQTGLARSGGLISIASRRPNRIELITESAHPSILVLSEIASPGWRVMVDGIETDWHKVNYMLRAVPLEAGNHRIEFFYLPYSLIIGAVISVMTALSLIVVWMTQKLKTQKNETNENNETNEL